jgi:hypothetical protein
MGKMHMMGRTFAGTSFAAAAAGHLTTSPHD